MGDLTHSVKQHSLKQVWSGECEEQSREAYRCLTATHGVQGLLSHAPNQGWNTSEGRRIISVRCHGELPLFRVAEEQLSNGFGLPQLLY